MPSLGRPILLCMCPWHTGLCNGVACPKLTVQGYVVLYPQRYQCCQSTACPGEGRCHLAIKVLYLNVRVLWSKGNEPIQPRVIGRWSPMGTLRCARHLPHVGLTFMCQVWLAACNLLYRHSPRPAMSRYNTLEGLCQPLYLYIFPYMLPFLWLSSLIHNHRFVFFV